MTRSSSRARQPLSRVNLTGFPFLNSGKNRKYLSISIKNLKTSLKTGFAQISLAAQNFGGGCSPPRPPGPYAYAGPLQQDVSSTHLGQASRAKCRSARNTSDLTEIKRAPLNRTPDNSRLLSLCLLNAQSVRNKTEDFVD